MGRKGSTLLGQVLDHRIATTFWELLVTGLAGLVVPITIVVEFLSSLEVLQEQCYLKKGLAIILDLSSVRTNWCLAVNFHATRLTELQEQQEDQNLPFGLRPIL